MAEILTTIALRAQLVKLFWVLLGEYILANPSNTVFSYSDWRYSWPDIKYNDDWEDNNENIRVIEVHARTLQQARAQLPPDVLELSYTSENVWIAGTYATLFKFTVELLPAHRYFEPKYVVQFNRLWDTESVLTNDEILINDDQSLVSYITNNTPSADMEKTVLEIAEIVSVQLKVALNDDNYEVIGPVYAKNTGNAINLYAYDVEKAERPEIPILHLKEPNDLVSAVQKLYFWGYWTNPRAALYEWHRALGRTDIRRYDSLAHLVNSWVSYGGIFTEKTDPNGFITDVAALKYVVPHKMQRVLHDLVDNWDADRAVDLGNTSEVIRYPREELDNTTIVAIGQNTSVSSPHVTKNKFKYSDILISIVLQDELNSRLVTRDLSTTYSDEEISELSHRLLYIDDFNWVVAEMVNISPFLRIWGFDYPTNSNFHVEVGDEVDIFDEWQVSTVAYDAKRIYLSDLSLLTEASDYAIAHGNNILPLFNFGQDGIGRYAEVYDEANSLSTNNINNKISIIRYHALSAPGTLVNNTVIDAQIRFANSTYTPNNNQITGSLMNYYGEHRVPDGHTWVKDITTVYMNVLHTIIDRWSIKGTIAFDEFNVVSQYDRDWGIGRGRAIINQINIV